MEPGLFDYVKDLSEKKDYLYDPMQDKNYVPYVINRAFAQNIDTILIANELNKHPMLTKRMHYDFLFYNIEPRKRYGKWVKADESHAAAIDAVIDRYQVNRDVALSYIKCMDEAALKELIEVTNHKGGVKQ